MKIEIMLFHFLRGVFTVVAVLGSYKVPVVLRKSAL